MDHGNRMLARLGAAAIVLGGLTGGARAAGDSYAVVRLSDLQVHWDELPADLLAQRWVEWETWAALAPYAVLEGEGEAYVGWDPERGGARGEWRPLQEAFLAVRTPAAGRVQGRLFVPRGDMGDILREGEESARAQGRPFVPHGDSATSRVLWFSVEVRPESESERLRFHEIEADHFERLVRRGVPGGGWFRHRLQEARGRIDPGGPRRIEDGRGVVRIGASASELEETFDLFSGGRAVSENLRLDRELEAGGEAVPEIPIGELAGITTAEMDWDSRVRELRPALDPLAARIPADQHAVFLPSIEALHVLVRELSRDAAPLLFMAEARAEDARTFQRYQRQLCLPLEEMAAELGPGVVRSVALTGSDPYLRTGSDVAVWLEVGRRGELQDFLARQHRRALTEEPGAQAVPGPGELAWSGVATPGREVCSYIAWFHGAALVTNSLAQIQRALGTHVGAPPPLASAPEYVFFRHRYPRGAEGESAFAVLTDATIRRWGSPRWRVGASRRTRAAAVMAEALASHVGAGAAGAPERGPAVELPGGERIEVSGRGARSSTWGTLEFLTPIAELEIDRVTRSEAEAYRTFRDRYQSSWREVFDPIAVSVSVSGERVAVDLSVIPLIAGTEYRELVSLTSGGRLEPAAGDPHAGTIAHFAMALGPTSDLLRGMGTFWGLPDPMQWLGGSASIYAEADPLWGEWREAAEEDDAELFFEEGFYRIPIAAEIAVKDPLKLAVFLTGLRTLSDQAAPDMTVWETLEHAGQRYVRITPVFEQDTAEGLARAALHYAALPDALILSLRQDVLERALERRAARRSGAQPLGGDGEPAQQWAAQPWMGESVALALERPAIALLAAFAREAQERRLQRAAWSNLPALGEWRRLFPREDPAAAHERLWGARPVCPGGGSYVWNEDWQTYESTVFGHPAAPRRGPLLPSAWAQVEGASFGLTFEEGGLRARAEIRR